MLKTGEKWSSSNICNVDQDSPDINTSQNDAMKIHEKP